MAALVLAGCATRTGTLTGTLTGAGTETEAGAPAAGSHAVELTTAEGVVHGTLLVPDQLVSPRTVVLIIAGSGPTDRDGNSPLLQGANNSLKLVAEALAEMGVASVRYDKRMIAESRAVGMPGDETRFRPFIDDAVGWLRMLRATGQYERVVVLGHSEGGLIGIIAAREAPADALITVAAAGRTLDVVVREQLAAQLPPPLLAQVDTIFDEVRAGRRVDNVPPMLMALVRPDIQPFLTEVFALDPAVEIARVEMPILVVQGTTDVQTSEVDARRLADATPRARLALIEGMNHVLKMVDGPLLSQLPSYSDPSLPLAGEFVRALRGFLE